MLVLEHKIQKTGTAEQSADHDQRCPDFLRRPMRKIGFDHVSADSNPESLPNQHLTQKSNAQHDAVTRSPPPLKLNRT